MSGKTTRTFTLFIVIVILISGLPVTKPQLVKAQQSPNVFLPLVLNGRPLVIGSTLLKGNFSPFFAKRPSDKDVVNLTQVNLLTTDRLGMVVNYAINGVTRYHFGKRYKYYGVANTNVEYNRPNDLTAYTAVLRTDLTFSDGVPVTIDDVIFTYYTLLDPDYDGPNKLKDYPILGLREYRAQVTTLIYERYEQLAEDIYLEGMFHTWSPNDPWTQAQQNYFWERVHQRALHEVDEIIAYCMDNYLDDYAIPYLHRTPEEIRANEGLQVAFGMAVWGFGSVNDSGALTTPSGRSWNLVTNFPSRIDFRDEIYYQYNYDVKRAFPNESVDSIDVFALAQFDFIRYWGPLDPEMGGQGIPNISGITKVDSTTIRIVLKGYNTADIYTVLGIPVAPLHYYGDTSKYDYTRNKFGFDFGDLSKQRSLSSRPLGAGPYVFSSFNEANRNVTLNANNSYFKGAPFTKTLNFIEVKSDQAVSALANGTIDISEVPFNTTRYQEIRNANSNGDYTGNVITTSMADILGYGYIGLNAANMNVGGDPSSYASRFLRKAFATIFAVYRLEAISAYYPGMANFYEYSILRTSWASPQPTDPDFSVAYSVNIQGAPIYTPDMTPDQRYAAARQAALEFFAAAGYTISNGRIVAAPQGAKLSYEFMLPGGGTGNHPAYGIALAAKASLQMIGMELVINDPANPNDFWDALFNGTQEVWAAAWGAQIDPDLYPIFHSDNVSDSNHYHIADPELDTLLWSAQRTIDQYERKDLIRQSLDIIRDWGVDVPTYVRTNATLFSTSRINTTTTSPLLTPFWRWMDDIELLKTN